MPHTWSCACGHRWQTDALPPSPGAPLCPVCGARAEAPGAPEETLERPGPAPLTAPPPPAAPQPADASPSETIAHPSAPPGGSSDASLAEPSPASGAVSFSDRPTAKADPAARPPGGGPAPPDGPAGDRLFAPGPCLLNPLLLPASSPGPLGETLQPHTVPGPEPTATGLGADDPDRTGISPGETLDRPSGAPTPGTRQRQAAVAGYEILDVLGRGGMGVVYKARQVGLNRLVALKMILAGGHAGHEELHRFQVEAEAVARLQHPNIVQVFEVGQRDGLPFFSLEFVDGGSLARRIAGEPMPARQAAALLETLARAVHHAHTQGIVHRDLKPANVLLTAQGMPKIADFGLAKRLEVDAGQTGTGAILGTPTYMAPEQAQGRTRDIGPPCDIYALGAILYDLLTGRPPFKGESVLDTLQLVQSVEPVPVRRLQPKVPHDLETITLKCLEKDPKKRYPSANALADDLRRFLDGEPVRARPTPAWERAWKWAKRRPAVAALLLVSAAAVLALTVGAVVFAGVESGLREAADREKDEALLQKAEAERQRRRADGQRDEALRQQAIAEKQRQRADGHLQRAFQAGDELLTRVEGRLIRVPRMEGVRRELLEKARAFYEGFFEVEGDTPEVRLQTGLAHHRLGWIQGKFSSHRKALASYEAALPLLKRVAAESPKNPNYLLALGAACNGYAVTLQALGRHADAERNYSEAVAALRRAKDLAPLPRYREQLAANLTAWAGCLGKDPGRRGQAEKAYEEALGLLAELCKEYPHEGLYQAQQARTLLNLGALLLPASAQKAEEVWGRALKLFEKLAAEHPDAPEYRLGQGETLINLGLARELLERPEQAAGAYGDAIELLEKLVDEYPRTTDFRHHLARGYTSLGLLREAGKDFTRAEAARAKARGHWEKLVKYAPDFPPFRQELARSLVDLAGAHWRADKAEEAGAALARAIGLQEELVKQHRSDAEYRLDLARSLMNLGRLRRREKQAAKAEAEYRRAIAVLEEARPKSGPPPAGWLSLRVWVQQGLILTLRDRKDQKGMAEALRDAIRYQGEVADGAPGDEGQRRLLASYHVALLDVLHRQRDHAGLSRAAKAYEPVLRRAGPSAGGEFVQAAKLVARCVALAEEDEGLPEAKRKELMRAYGDQAMGLLREAVGRNYRDAARLRDAADLQPLAERADFRRLLSELEAGKGGEQR
jgi:eukaryotic-like serine/threonine-protein kinase